MALPPSRKAERLASDVKRINGILANLHITLEHPRVEVDSAGFLRLDERRLDPTRIAYTRIFNESWNMGGRLYGPFWQSLSSEVRAGLRINGEPVFEYDIPACHIRLLRAWRGLSPLPDGTDPYAIDGIPRSIVKKALLIGLNCSNRKQAERALQHELRLGSGTGLTAKSILDPLELEIPDIPLFTRAALRLQNMDGNVCVRVHHACADRGIPVLSVHDSFICPKSHEAIIRKIVMTEFEEVCDRMRRRAARRR